MCVTCYTPDPRELTVLEWHTLAKPHYMAGLKAFLEGPQVSPEDADTLLASAKESTLDRLQQQGRRL